MRSPSYIGRGVLRIPPCELLENSLDVSVMIAMNQCGFGATGFSFFFRADHSQKGSNDVKKSMKMDVIDIIQLARKCKLVKKEHNQEQDAQHRI